MLANSRVWTHGLTHPIYIPVELGEVRERFAAGEFKIAIDHLCTRASLGSCAAAAVLDYICLRERGIVGVDVVAVSHLCRACAMRSNGYAQYIVACRAYEDGSFQEYAKWLHRSARQNFLPAITDVGRALIGGQKLTHNQIRLAKRYFWRAARGGHVLAITIYLRACWRGTFGKSHRAIAFFALPGVILINALLIRFFPFSVGLFAYHYGAPRRLFSL
jgi:hypothetical protein